IPGHSLISRNHPSQISLPLSTPSPIPFSSKPMHIPARSFIALPPLSTPSLGTLSTVSDETNPTLVHENSLSYLSFSVKDTNERARSEIFVLESHDSLPDVLIGEEEEKIEMIDLTSDDLKKSSETVKLMKNRGKESRPLKNCESKVDLIGNNGPLVKKSRSKSEMKGGNTVRMSPQCVLCEAHPSTISSYTQHLNFNHKSTMNAIGLYILCSCGLIVRSNYTNPNHSNECDGRKFTLHKHEEMVAEEISSEAVDSAKKRRSPRSVARPRKLTALDFGESNEPSVKKVKKESETKSENISGLGSCDLTADDLIEEREKEEAFVHSAENVMDSSETLVSKNKRRPSRSVVRPVKYADYVGYSGKESNVSEKKIERGSIKEDLIEKERDKEKSVYRGIDNHKESSEISIPEKKRRPSRSV
ncbi:hypothetical protein PENTCL1PPCAC_13384, partial [Pristionchus entomophagus]